MVLLLRFNQEIDSSCQGQSQEFTTIRAHRARPLKKLEFWLFEHWFYTYRYYFKNKFFFSEKKGRGRRWQNYWFWICFAIRQNSDWLLFLFQLQFCKVQVNLSKWCWGIRHQVGEKSQEKKYIPCC